MQQGPISLPANTVLPTTILIQRWNGLPMITASVNNSLVEHLVLDTGLNANVIVPTAAKNLALGPLPSQTHLTVWDTGSDAPEAQVQRLRAGGLILENIPVALFNVPALLSLQPRPDAPIGWLGTPFLSAFQVTFEANALSVTLDKPTAALPRTRGTTVVPLILRDGRPFVKVSLPGAKPFLALVDTGSPGTVIPTEAATALKLKSLKEWPITRAEGKQGKAALVELPQLGLGKAERKGMRVIYLLPESPKEFDKHFAVLGMDFLSAFNVTLNYARQQMALAPPSKPKASGEEPPP